MGIFDKLGGNLIADRIRSEAVKAIDRYVENSVINALLPHHGEDGHAVKLTASLTVKLDGVLVEYTEHMGKDCKKTLTIPAAEKQLALDSTVKAARPGVMAESSVISGEELELAFAGKISGIGFRQMMMGVGATIDAVTVRLTVSGTANGVWLGQETGESK